MIYLCAAPEELLSARRFFPHIAHAACHIKRSDHPTLIPPQFCSKKDLLLITAEENALPPQSAGFFRAFFEHYFKAGLTGAAVDIPPPVTTEKLRFLSFLAQKITSSNGCFFVPEEFSVCLPDSIAVVCTAMSGGFFSKRVEDSVSRFGKNRVALDLQRLIMDFTIPAPTGTGTPLSHSELKNLLSSHRPAVFFSRELCAKYFTLHLRGHLHLILFDDTATLLEKIRIGKSLGISHFFFSYPEVTDILAPLSLAVNKEKTL